MDNPIQDSVAEGKPPTRDSRPASTGNHPNAQVNDVSSETLEGKATTTEQPTSLKDYFVRYDPSYGALIHQVMWYVADPTQRILAFTTSRDRAVLTIALLCSVGSGVVCVFLYCLSKS